VSATLAPAPPTPAETARPRQVADVLVIGACLIAPLNLLIVRSLTVYDAVLFVGYLQLIGEGRLRWPQRRYLAMGYVFVLASLLSAFRALYPTEALTQVLQYAFVFFVQIPAVLSVVTSRRRAVICVVLLCVGTVAAMLHAYLVPETQGAGRSLVFYSDNPNRLGYPAVYVLPFAVALWHLSRGRGRAARLGTLLACAGATYLSLWAVFASGSRSSLVGCAAALVVLVVLRPDMSAARRLRRALALAAVVGVVGAGLVAGDRLPDTLTERVTRSMDADIGDRTHLVGDRENLAEAGVLAFLDSPLLGTGLDNFRYVTTNYNVDATPQLPHNLWLQLLVQVGLVGTVALALLLLFWARDLAVAEPRALPPDRELLWSTVSAMAGILTIFMFAPEMLDRHYWLIFALGLAFVAGAGSAAKTGGTP
jgi:O-antigen ligase